MTVKLRELRQLLEGTKATPPRAQRYLPSQLINRRSFPTRLIGTIHSVIFWTWYTPTNPKAY
jgi:hypothetical protein